MPARRKPNDQPDDAMRADWPACACTRDEFIAAVWREGAIHRRDLPWRDIDDPYAVLVSEVMLQQTQVARVLNYWPRFMAAFPTVDALAAAGASDVLALWQGLGYNRRALALKRACDACAAERGGKLPETVEELVKLPGIGPATAAGVVAFAHDKPAVYLETNVRSVLLHLLFPDEDAVPDKRLVPYLADTCPQEGARAWYYALLDFGAHLKSAGANPSRRSAQYSRQGKFEGSRRQKRSFVLKSVLAAEDGISVEELACALDRAEEEAGRQRVERGVFESIVAEMLAEGFFRQEGDTLLP